MYFLRWYEFDIYFRDIVVHNCTKTLFVLKILAYGIS